MAPCILRSELCYLRGPLLRPPPDGLLVVLKAPDWGFPSTI